MKLYRCDLCGRVFHEIIPHVCVHGNYRKRNLTFTELEDVDCEYVKKPEVDVKEKYFPNIPQGTLMLQERAEPKIEFTANMEHMRYEIAKSVMSAMLSHVDLSNIVKRDEYLGNLSLQKYLTKASCVYADALIAELKRKDDGEESQQEK